MAKKIISLILALTFVMSAAPSVFAKDFTDLNNGHWAYKAISTLVAEGTINGYEDGSFKPNETVTRAQFVKMIGKGNVRTTDKYKDVNSSDWFYKYVMYSGLEPVNSQEFKPNQPITRDDCIKLLWTRNGSSDVNIVPMLITGQSKTPKAAAWAYAKGIMMGDDYINLRLNDSLTRAEAAALIVRARENAKNADVNFSDNIDDKLLKELYDRLSLFDDKEYDPNATVTVGEVAFMASRLACGQKNVTYENLSFSTPFEHKYAEAMDVFGRYCVGTDKITEEYMNKTATKEDALKAVALGVEKSTTKYISSENLGSYKDVKASNDREQVVLNVAYNAGLTLYGDGNIKAKEKATLRDIMILVLEANGVSGFGNSYKCNEYYQKVNYKLRTDLASYPKNADKYAVILEGIPNKVYEDEYVVYKAGANVGVPKNEYNSARDFRRLYDTGIENISKVLNEKGIDVDITYYPSMVIYNGKGYTMRVKFEFNDMVKTQLATFMPLAEDVENIWVEGDMTFYADLAMELDSLAIFCDSSTTILNNIIK